MGASAIELLIYIKKENMPLVFAKMIDYLEPLKEFVHTNLVLWWQTSPEETLCRGL
jgi:hypothetical protein